MPTESLPARLRVMDALASTAGQSLIVLLAGTAFLWPALASLWDNWREIHDYEHGILIFGVSAVWAIALRRRLAAIPSQPAVVILGPLAVVLLAFAIAWKGNNVLGVQILFPLALGLAVWAACGLKAAKVLAPPLAYLYLAIPVWEYAVPLLQAMSVVATESFLKLVGITATVEGSLVRIPEGVFHIAEGCSGKRYLIVTLATTALGAALFGLNRTKFVVALAIATASALFANWIRICIVVYAGHVTDMQSYLVAVEHRTLGYVIFALLLALNLFVVTRLSKGAAAAPATTETTERLATHGRWWYAVVILAVASLATLPPASGAAPSLGAMPVLTDSWSGPFAPSGQWQPQFAGASQALHATYSSKQGAVEVYVNVFGVQNPEHELVRYDHRPFDHTHWKVTRSQASVGGPTFLVVRGPGEQNWVVGYVYNVGGTLTSNDGLAQAVYGAKSLFRAVPAGVLAIGAPCAADCDAADGLTRRFWADMGDRLLQMVPSRFASTTN